MKYNVDTEDVLFIMDVVDRLKLKREHYEKEITWFINRLQNDPGYVYHFDEEYWSDVIEQRRVGNDTSIAERYAKEACDRNDKAMKRLSDI